MKSEKMPVWKGPPLREHFVFACTCLGKKANPPPHQANPSCELIARYITVSLRQVTKSDNLREIINLNLRMKCMTTLRHIDLLRSQLLMGRVIIASTRTYALQILSSVQNHGSNGKLQDINVLLLIW